MVFREDFISCEKVRVDSETGILQAMGTIARVGVQAYTNPLTGDGRYEFRSPEEVSKSVDSFKGVPITVNHPRTRKVTATNLVDELKGVSGTPKFNSDVGLVDADLTIHHPDAVKAATTTHKQLSCGYDCDLVEESGVWTDSLGIQGPIGKEYPYTHKQTNIVGNHIALCVAARAGNIAKLHLDSEDADPTWAYSVRLDSEDVSIPEIEALSTTTKTIPMPKQIIHNDNILMIDGEGAEAVANLVSELKSTNAELAAQVEAAEGDRNDALAEEQAKSAALKVKLEAAETSLAAKNDSAENPDIGAEVAARLELWAEVLPTLRADSADFQPDYNLSAIEVQKAYIAKAWPDLDLSVHEDSQIPTLWSVLGPKSSVIKVDSKQEKPSDKARQALNAHVDADETRVDAAYDGTKAVTSVVTANRRRNRGKNN